MIPAAWSLIWLGAIAMTGEFVKHAGWSFVIGWAFLFFGGFLVAIVIEERR